MGRIHIMQYSFALGCGTSCCFYDKMWKHTRWKNEDIARQESPPAWTQEAYRPPRSKCSLCWSVSWWGRGGGYPIQSKPGMGPPCNGGQSENITFRHPLDAGGENPLACRQEAYNPRRSESACIRYRGLDTALLYLGRCTPPPSCLGSTPQCIS